jgi:hypothetical protein
VGGKITQNAGTFSHAPGVHQWPVTLLTEPHFLLPIFGIRDVLFGAAEFDRCAAGGAQGIWLYEVANWLDFRPIFDYLRCG